MGVVGQGKMTLQLAQPENFKYFSNVILYTILILSKKWVYKQYLEIPILQLLNALIIFFFISFNYIEDLAIFMWFAELYGML